MSLRSILARRRAGSVLALATFTVLSTSVYAADVIKADNTDALEVGTAWGGSNTPTVNDVAVFNSTLAANSAFNLGLAQSWGGIRVADPFAPLSITGTVNLTLGRFGIDMSGATQDLTINTPVVIQGAPGIYDWNVAAGRTLTLAALPAKIGRTTPTGYNFLTAAHMGIVRMSTTGTIKLGVAQTNLLIDNQNNPYATYGDNDWAATDASGIVVAATYNNSDSGVGFAGTNLNMVSDSAGPNGIDVASIRFDDPTARSLTIQSSATARTMTARGILVTANSGGGSIINGPGLNAGFIRPSRSSSGAGQITNFPIIQNSASDFTIGAVISDASSSTPVNVVKYGSGKLILTGPNGHSGGTTIVGGTIEVGGTLGTLGGTRPVYNQGALILNRTAGTLTINQIIAGDGSIEFKGAGTYVLGGANTYTAANNLNGGLVEPTSAAGLGTSNTLNFNGGGYRYNAAYTPDLSTFTTTVGAGGATIDTNGSNVSFAGNFGSGGAGGLTKIGAGTLTLGGASNYGGSTSVNVGGLIVNGALAGSVNVAGSATIGGSGSIGALTVASGGTVSPGASVGTLTTNGLTLDAGSLLNIEFGTGNDMINAGAGAVTLNGGILSLFQENSATPFSAVGSYNIIQHAGSVGGAGATSLSVANQQPGFLYNFTDVGGFVKLNIIQNGVVSGWITDGGSSWGNAANWSGGNIPTNAGDAAQFSTNLTAPSNVTMDGNRTVGGISFNSANGYTILPGSGGTLTLNGNLVPTAQLNASLGSHVISVPVNMTATTVLSDIATGAQISLNGSVGGNAALTKSGGGTLVLANSSNSYSGATSVTGGTLQVGGIGSLGTNPALNLSGGGVIKYAPGMTNDLSSAKTVTLGAGGGGIDTNGNDVTFATSLPGTGGLVKAGAGKLTLTTANAYTGATVVRGGTLSMSANDQLGDVPTQAGLTLDGGALEATAGFSMTDGTLSRSLTVGAGGGTITVADGQSLTIPGASSGAGQLTLTGPGTTNMVGTSTRTGVTRIEGGFAAVYYNDGVTTFRGSLGSGQVDLVGGALTIGDTRLNNTLNVIGTGAINGGSGGGAADLTTVIGSGNLVLNITTGVFDLEGDMTGFSGTLDVVNAGSGGIRMNGTTFSANMTLNLGAGTSIARRNTTTTYNIGALTGQGNVNAITATTGNTTYNIGGKNIDATFDGIVGDSLDGTTGAVVGQTLITKVGTGTQIFNGENYYSGLTTIQGGTLQLGPNAQTPILGGNTPIAGFPVAAGGADIQLGKLVYDYTGGSSPSGTIVPILDAGFDVGFLTGTIRSTTATSLRGLGWVDDAANSKFIIGAALYGDTNLSGAVDFDDLLVVAQNYSLTSTGLIWAQGDSNYDGLVNFDDLLALAQNYGGSLSVASEFAGSMGESFSQDWALALSVVPEPTTLGLLAGLGAIGLRRRRD